MEFIVYLAILGIFGAIGYSIPKDPEQKPMAAFLGFILGPIGLVIVAIMNR